MKRDASIPNRQTNLQTKQSNTKTIELINQIKSNEQWRNSLQRLLCKSCHFWFLTAFCFISLQFSIHFSSAKMTSFVVVAKERRGEDIVQASLSFQQISGEKVNIIN